MLIVCGLFMMLLVLVPLFSGSTFNGEPVRYSYKSAEEVPKIVERVLKKKTGKYRDFFVVEVSGKENSFYDCQLVYKDIRTDYAYVFADVGGELLMADRTMNKSVKKILEKIDQFVKAHPEEELEARQKKEKEDLLAKLTGSLETLEQYFIYSCEEDCFYSVLSYTAKEENGTYFADMLRTPFP